MSNMPTAQIAQINGNALAFYEWGQQGSPVLICLHSHTNSAASWREFAEFASSKYHVFCPRSTWPWEQRVGEGWLCARSICRRSDRICRNKGF